MKVSPTAMDNPATAVRPRSRATARTAAHAATPARTAAIASGERAHAERFPASLARNARPWTRARVRVTTALALRRRSAAALVASTICSTSRTAAHAETYAPPGRAAPAGPASDRIGAGGSPLQILPIGFRCVILRSAPITARPTRPTKEDAHERNRYRSRFGALRSLRSSVPQAGARVWASRC